MTPYVFHIIHNSLHFSSLHLVAPLPSVGVEGLQKAFPIYNNTQNTTERRPVTVFTIRETFRS